MIRWDEINPAEASKSDLVSAFDFLRSSIKTREYSVFLFLLILGKDGMISNEIVSVEENVHAELASTVTSNANTNREVYQQIYQVFAETIESIPTAVLFNLIKRFCAVDFSRICEDFAGIFDYFVLKNLRAQGKTAPEYLLPLEVSQFISELVNLRPNSKIYNPFAGLASFAVFAESDAKYVGQELDINAWAIGVLRLMAYERRGESFYLVGDSIRQWNPKGEKYDLIISSPPFGQRINESDNNEFTKTQTVEAFFIQEGLKDLTEGGKLIAVLPNGYLFRGGEVEKQRRYLVENDLLDSVISFPGGLLFNTQIPFIVLVVGTRKDRPNYVRFVDAKRFVTDDGRERRLSLYGLTSILSSGSNASVVRFVANDLIAKNEFNINVPRYFAGEVGGDELERFAKPISRTERDRPFGKLVAASNLIHNSPEVVLDSSKLALVELDQNCTPVTSSCIIVVLIGRKLMPTVFRFNGEPIYIKNQLAAFEIDHSLVDLEFLARELRSDYVEKQLEHLRLADLVPTLRQKDFLKVKIKLPELQEQIAKVKGIKEAMAGNNSEVENLSKTVSDLQGKMFEQSAYLRHVLVGPTSNLKGFVNSVLSIFENQIVPNYPDIPKLKVSRDHKLALSEYLYAMKRDIFKISDALGKQLKVDIDLTTKTLYPINIPGFLQKFVKEFNDRPGRRFQLALAFDKNAFTDETGLQKDAFIDGNVDLLTDLLNNLISNAEKHAFTTDYEHRIEIFVMREMDDALRNELQILISNTGMPFPENFTVSDFARKGSKTGTNAGDGYGGWYIYEITKYLNGRMDIIDETGPEGLGDTDLATSFEFTFPIVTGAENETV